MSSDDANQITAVWSSCVDQRHNLLYPNNPRVTVVTPAADGPDNSVHVESVEQNNLAAVHNLCVIAAHASSANAINIATDSGPADCDSFLHGVQQKLPLIVLAPTGISGNAVTIHDLSMIGAGKSSAEIQPEVDKLNSDIKESSSYTPGDIANAPLVHVDAKIINAGPVPAATPPPASMPKKVFTCIASIFVTCR